MISISPHTHPESQLTGSTLAAMIKRAVALKRTHFSYTDLGHLSSCLKAYTMAKKAGLKFAPGIEFYFKDPKCQILGGSKADRCKYFTSSLYCKTQASYQELCRLVSKTDRPTMKIQDEFQSLWSWNEIEHMSKFETLMVLGGIHCIAGKTFLAGEPEKAEQIILKMKDLFGDRLSFALIAEPWAKKYAVVVEIFYEDGTRDALMASDLVATNKAKEIKAIDLVNRSGHYEIESKIVGQTYYKVYKKIKSVKEHKGFLPLPGDDVTLRINKFLLEMSKKHGIPALVSDYAFYAEKTDHIVQTMVLEGTDKLKSDLHMKAEDEFAHYLESVMGMSPGDSIQIMDNNNEWAKNFDKLELKYELRLADGGENPLQQCIEIMKKRGRIDFTNPIHVARIREEISVIAKNGRKDFSAYFLPIYDVIEHYRENRKLTGPMRGSAGGSFFCYAMGITQADPIRYGLSFPRFLSLDRLKNGDIPDIDTDFPDRELLIGKDGQSGYLYGRWGNKAAQISTRHTVRLKSAVTDTNRYINGSVEDEVKSFSKALPDPPQGVPDKDFVFGYEDTDGNHIMGLLEQHEPLKAYMEKRPDEWAIVQKALGITRAHSLHASAFVLSDVPISDVVPTKEGHITQYEAKQCEAAGLIKYDFLTVSNIKDIEVCLKLINKKNGEDRQSPEDIVGWWHSESDSGTCADCQDTTKFVSECTEPVDIIPRSYAGERACGTCGNYFRDAKKPVTIGYFTHKGKLEYIWDLPIDEDAFKSCWNGDTATLFQINTKSMIPFVKEILPQNVEDISVILALVRPGPMDYIDPVTNRSMAMEYVYRRQGKSEPDLVELYELIKETYGVIVFQEQSLKISKELGGMTPADAEKLRRIFSKKLKKEAGEMKPVFMGTAIAIVGEEKANKIWDMMETSARYSFNLAHSVGYGLITYAGIFLKHNYPLEWWAAILTNAKEKEISGKLWPYVRDLVAPPDINLSTDQMEIDYGNEKIRAKFGVIRGIGTKTIDPIVQGRPYRDIQDFVNKEVAGPGLTRKLTHVGVLDSLYPPRSTLIEKLQMYEDAVELKKYKEKFEAAQLEGKNIRAIEAKKGRIPEEYLNTEKNPLKNAAVQKSVLPSLLVGMYTLAQENSICAIGNKPARMMSPPSDPGKQILLVSGENVQRLDEVSGHEAYEDRYVAACGFIVEAKEFAYAGNSKRALKCVIDFDGFVAERVLWPHYQTKELVYPKELKKGNICTVFLKKRAGKDDPCSIVEIVIEA